MTTEDTLKEFDHTSMKRPRNKMNKYTSLILFCLPALIFYVLFLLIPTFGAAIYSFTNIKSEL